MVCIDCEADKPKSAFYNHPQMKKGVLGSCKECRKTYQRALYYQKMKDPAWVAKERRRSLSKACSPSGMARMRRYRSEYPERYAANKALNNALRDGRIAKPKNCENCGQTKWLHGHHSDYSKPLEVKWICARCHRMEP